MSTFDNIAATLNGTNKALATVQANYPDESVLFTSAATMHETTKSAPLGWSIQRLLQERGAVIITEKRCFIATSFQSPFTIFWLVFTLYALGSYYVGRQPASLLLAVVAIGFLLQRLPTSTDIPFADAKRIDLRIMNGMLGSADIVSIILDGKAKHIVPRERLSAEIKQHLKTAAKSS